MVKTVTWLHISDTHFCKEKHGWKSNPIYKSFFDDLRYMKNKHQLFPDLVFFTGDVALGHIKDDNGYTLKDQYEEANDFLNKILNIFPDLKKSNIFIVPGNHDINRNKTAEYHTKWLEGLKEEGREAGSNRINQLIIENKHDWKEFMARLNEYKEFLENCGYKHLLEDPDRLTYSTKRHINGFELGIVGLNSAWSSYGGDKDKNHLWLGTYQVLKSYYNIEDTMFSIGISHHPPNWFTDYEEETISHEIKNKFNFYLHGHEHRDWVSTIDKKHVHIASGAIFSGSEYSGSEQKSGYNFVRLYPLENRAEIFLRTYNDGWVPNFIGKDKIDNNGVCNLDNLNINIQNQEHLINESNIKAKSHAEEFLPNTNALSDKKIQETKENYHEKHEKASQSKEVEAIEQSSKFTINNSNSLNGDKLINTWDIEAQDVFDKPDYQNTIINSSTINEGAYLAKNIVRRFIEIIRDVFDADACYLYLINKEIDLDEKSAYFYERISHIKKAYLDKSMIFPEELKQLTWEDVDVLEFFDVSEKARGKRWEKNYKNRPPKYVIFKSYDIDKSIYGEGLTAFIVREPIPKLDLTLLLLLRLQLQGMMFL